MTTRKRSTFFGPQHALKTEYPNVLVYMQLFNIEPGEFWDPSLETDLLTPRLLVPRSGTTEALFLHIGLNFVWIFRIGPNRNWIQVRTNRSPTRFAFDFRPRFAIHKFAYNEQTTPAGVYGINGSATMSWQRV